MTDFDRTLTLFHMQDELACKLDNLAANIHVENAWNKVAAAFRNAELAPAFV